MAIVTDSPVVRIEFSVTDEAGEFRDAITLPFDEYLHYTQKDIDAIADQRHADWKAFVAAQSAKTDGS